MKTSTICFLSDDTASMNGKFCSKYDVFAYAFSRYMISNKYSLKRFVKENYIRYQLKYDKNIINILFSKDSIEENMNYLMALEIWRKNIKSKLESLKKLNIFKKQQDIKKETTFDENEFEFTSDITIEFEDNFKIIDLDKEEIKSAKIIQFPRAK